MPNLILVLLYHQIHACTLQVSRRLPRSAMDPLLGPLPPCPCLPPDTAFTVSRGTGEHEGLVLYSHKTHAVGEEALGP